MNLEYNSELERVFESADFFSDDFENYGFDEYAESISEDDDLSMAVKALDDSLSVIKINS